MIIAVLRIKIHAPWVHSLKEKRMVVRSLCSKLQNQFHVSVAEVSEQDKHQMIVLGISSVAGNTPLGDSIMDHILEFIESNTEGEVIEVERENLPW